MATPASLLPSPDRHAVLYRMVRPDHLCPHGLKAKWQLERHGYAVEDHWLTDRAETDAFKAAHGVTTTPQAFIGGRRIGGNSELIRFFAGHEPATTSYRPVVAVFALTALLALAASRAAFGTPLTRTAGEWFVGFSMTALALLKLQDVERFSTMFLSYDLLARRWVPYAYLYPFAEALAGLLMVAHVALWLAVPLALALGTIGAASVVKAVYLDRRDLTCACVGGASNVPLGMLSLTENLLMIAMAVWMLAR